MFGFAGKRSGQINNPLAADDPQLFGIDSAVFLQMVTNNLDPTQRRRVGSNLAGPARLTQSPVLRLEQRFVARLSLRSPYSAGSPVKREADPRVCNGRILRRGHKHL